MDEENDTVEPFVFRPPIGIVIVLIAAAVGIALIAWQIYLIGSLSIWLRLGVIAYAAIAAVIVVLRLSAHVRVDKDGITVSGPLGRRIIRWSDVAVYEVKPIRFTRGEFSRRLKDASGRVLFSTDLLLLFPENKSRLARALDSKLANVRRQAI